MVLAAIRNAITLVLIGVFCLVTGPVVSLADDVIAPERVTHGLQVLYSFDDAANGVIADRSGVGEPLNLRIDKPQAAAIRSGKLVVTSAATIASDGPARKITEAVKQSNELTIEAWLRPRDAHQNGPARIVSLSVDPSNRNFTLGQDKERFDVRLRTTSTDNNGQPSTTAPEGSASKNLSHVVFTRAADGVAKVFVNGEPVVSTTVAGDFSNWSDECRLSVANEVTGDRPWLGDLHLVAIYSRSLTIEEVGQNFRAGLPATVDYAALLPPSHAGTMDFVKDIQPILRQHCYECHSADNEDGGVNLGIRQRALLGGNNGPIFVAGDSANSRLIHLVAAIEKDAVMPPESQGLSKDEISRLRAWIDQGAVWPEGTDVADTREELARTHWAFQPLKRVQEPAVKNAPWARTQIDRFILARLEEAGIEPQPAASPRQLVRRVTFDLIGLPPTPKEVDEFCEAAAKDHNAALSALVERLLLSPHYGERWGRHWLDVARYADSDGQESDRDRPTAYHYRDFVIRAFNNDMPFDQFVRWQLAGDEYERANPDAVAATGFLTAGPFAALPDRLMEDERLRNRYNELDDLLSTVGTGFLGLTLGCVRCHDHKYDAIPARDYYSMMSAFHGGERAEVPLGNTEDTVLAFHDLGPDPKPTWLFQRGNYYDRDQPVSLGFVSILTNGKSAEDYWKAAREQSPAKDSTKQRRALADWMTDVEQGAGALLARVIVNRIWQHHFGHGLVRTAGDFGVRSEPPTHPELLEFLARDLIENGWSIKRLQRMIVGSAVFQQSSSGTAPALDLENRLLWKFPMFRLEGEILRDSMLAVSGTLNTKSYGPAVKPPIAAEAMLARNLKDSYPDKIEDTPEIRRRSIYLFHKRVVPYPLLQAFDKPDAQQSCSRRDHTTVAPQALALLNDPFVRTVAFEFADRLIKDGGTENERVIEQGYQLALARSASDEETDSASEFIASQIRERKSRDTQAADDQIRRQSVADFCQVLFLYVD
jgi:Protein of unknown function (DUF1553)/Protein of unknown function (DUF1549)/Concanavalin A-like lectin/glucanases superfamily/Planctomycete cytochrome C